MKSLLKILMLVGFMAASGYATVVWVKQTPDMPTSGPASAPSLPAQSASPAAASSSGSPQVDATATSGTSSALPFAPAATASSGNPLSADVYVIRGESFSERLPAYGTLTANETVEITNEIAGRLSRIHAEDGAIVQAGQLLFEFDATELEAQLKELEVRERFAGIREARLKKLLDEKVISPQEYDEAQSSTEGFTAQIEALKVRIGKMNVRAPFSGQLGLRRVSLGAWVEPGDVMTTLQDLSIIKVDFKVPERYAAFVSLDAPIRFRVEGQDRWSSATVKAIQPQVEAETRSLLVRGLAENPERILLPGAFVSVQLEVRSSSNSILIPSEAVIPTPLGASVFLDQAGRVEQREVFLGVRTADRVQVLGGLEPGQRLIVNNLLRLKPGAAVVGRVVNLDEGQPRPLADAGADDDP